MNASALAPGGSLSRAMPSYEDRPGQRRMALAVAETLEHGGVLMVEAGTGTGKTLAYLVPAALSGRRVVVSTGTRALQDQLALRDVATVTEILDRPVSAAVLKGTSNYLCRRRFAERAIVGGTHTDELERLTLWVQETVTGDRAELREPSLLWPQVSTPAEGRLGPRCPYESDCFVSRARQRAEDAAIVIVNHHLFFADLALRERGGTGILPGYEAVIFDEAHLIESAATEHFGHAIGSAGLLRLFDELDAYADRSGDSALASQLSGARQHFQVLEAALLAVIPAQGRTRDVEGVFSGEPGRQAWLGVDDRLAQASARLTDGDEPDRREPAVLAKRVRSARDALAAVAEADDYARVRSGERDGKGVRLSSSLVDVSKLLRDRVLDTGTPVVLTSATLRCAGSFAHQRRRLGLEELGDELSIESPFDYGKQALLYVATDLPDPREDGFILAAAARIAELIDITFGRTLALFTSHRVLRKAAADLREWLTVPVLVQGDGEPMALLDEFRRTEESVLLATGTFWQGVDVPGSSLSQVIIDKLPFAPPDDPLATARARFEEESGRDPFYDYQVPEAALAFAQGVGRLIRRKDDRGIVSVLDRRLLARRYGKVFLDSLPAELPRTASLERVRRWWDGE